MSTVLITFALVTGLAFVWWVIFNTQPDIKVYAFLVPPILAFLHKVRRNKVKAKPFHLTPSFGSGVFGGFVGGIIAGLFIAIFGASVATSSVILFLQTVSFTAIGGAILGGSIQLMILWFRHLAVTNQYPGLAFNEVSGGIVGGAIGGIAVGLFEMVIFGWRDAPFVGIVPLVTGVSLGVILIALGALFYDYRGSRKNVARAFITSLLVTACAVTASIVILQSLNVEALVASSVYKAGALLGVTIGGAAGLQVGLTLLLYRLRRVDE